MFNNVKQILPIVYLKERQNMKFIDELIAEDVIPIGYIVTGVKSYYKDKEIREIINDIKKVNKLKSSNLSVGQEIKIPTI